MAVVVRRIGKWGPATTALAALVVVAGSAPAPVRPVEAAAPATVEQGGICLTELSPERLDTLFDTEPGGVVGADYQRAFAMPDGRVLWTFQDAAIRVAANEIEIVHNIAVLQDGLCFTVLYGGTRSRPTSFLFASRTVPYRRWFWPMDATVGTDGRIHVFVAEMEERGAEYLTRTVPVGTWVAVFDPSSDGVVDEVRPPNLTADLYGWSITSDESWTYLYAHCYRQFGFDEYAGVLAFDRSCATDITVGRVPLGEVAAPPTYWDGSRWQADPGRAHPIIDTAGRRINADQIEWTGARFLSVNKEGDWWGDTVLLSESVGPTGPFRVYDSVHAAVKCDGCNTFFANWVPSAAVGRTDRSAVFSIAHNRWDGVITSLYRPTFHEVAVPKFLPAGSSFSFRAGESGDIALLNVVAVEPEGAGYLVLYPCERGVPATSNVNFVGQPLVSNLAVVRADAHGRVCVRTSATTDVVVDLAGTFPAASSSFVPVDPSERLVDTRSGAGAAPLAGGGTLRVELPPGRPAGDAVVNVVSVGHAAPGYLTVFPCDRERPATSNLNYVTEPIVSNLVVTATDDSRAFCVWSSAETHVVVDLAGVFPADDTDGFDARDAVRLADTREGDPASRLVAGATMRVDVPASGDVVALNLIAIGPDGPGYLTVFPCDVARPDTSNLNYATAPIVANLVVTRSASDGSMCVYTSTAVDVVVDFVGEMNSDSGFVTSTVPLRVVDSRNGRGIDGQLGSPVDLG